MDSVTNDDGSITVTRLFRGRRGTEDITDADAVSDGDFVVLFENGPVSPQIMPISELNTTFVYRGVTTGNFIEQAFPVSFSYTGRDSRPHSVVGISQSPGSPDGVDVVWQRRARGIAGSLSLVPPLNETKEEYKGRLKDNVGAVIQTKTVTAEAVSFSQAEIDVATAPATIEITMVSGTGLESPVTPDSTVTVS